MRIVYYTGSAKGAGRLFIGMSIGNALKRKNIKCKFSMVHYSRVPHVADDFHNIKIPSEHEGELLPVNYHKSALYKTLKKLKPDILLVNHQWFTLYHFLNELKCKKIYLADYTYDSHFSIAMDEITMKFRESDYDMVLAIEPFKTSIKMKKINPLIIRNRDEILNRDTALERLNLDGSKKNAIFAFSFHPEHYDRFCEKYTYLEEQYDIFQLALFGDSLIPLVDYYNAFELFVGVAGYNSVWEANYFQKEAIFEPIFMHFHDHKKRIKASKEFHFKENGADQLVDILTGL